MKKEGLEEELSENYSWGSQEEGAKGAGENTATRSGDGCGISSAVLVCHQVSESSSDLGVKLTQPPGCFC